MVKVVKTLILDCTIQQIYRILKYHCRLVIGFMLVLSACASIRKFVASTVIRYKL